MKTPSWWNENGMMSSFMQPLSCIYGLCAQWRNALSKPTKMSVPVLCVGNFTAGGAGKTPTVMSLAYKLTAKGERPHIISRGYGGSIKESVMVDVTAHHASDVGDEPLLLSQAAPCWIGRDRVKSAYSAIARGATVLLMDDGFQNPSLTKDMSLIVVDGGYGLGNEQLLPAGPLREPLGTALARTDKVLIIGDDRHNIADKMGDVSVIYGNIKPNAELSYSDYMAFAGIGRPDKFYDTLRGMGANLVSTYDFADHHAYSDNEIEQLIKQAKQQNARLITTEKDAIKIPKQYMEHIDVLPVIIDWGDAEDTIIALLDELMLEGGI